MSNWKVSEKGEPSDKWELSVIDMDAEDAAQLARSYAWQGPHKIIVWSSAGSADYKALPALTLHLRHAAEEYASELNAAAQRSENEEAAAANTPRVPLNPLYYDHVTNDVDESERWAGDFPCTVTTVTAGGLTALNLIVRNAPDNIDWGEVNAWLRSREFTYHDSSVAAPQRYDLESAKPRDRMNSMFVTVYEKTTGVAHQFTVTIAQQK